MRDDSAAPFGRLCTYWLSWESVRNIAAAYDLTQPVDGSLDYWILKGMSRAGPVLTSHEDYIQVSLHVLLATYDHLLILSEMRPNRIGRPRLPGASRIRLPSLGRGGVSFWMTLRTMCFPLDDTIFVTEAILLNMECYFPSPTVRVGRRSQPWFGRACTKPCTSKCMVYQSLLLPTLFIRHIHPAYVTLLCGAQYWWCTLSRLSK